MGSHVVDSNNFEFWPDPIAFAAQAELDRWTVWYTREDYGIDLRAAIGYARRDGDPVAEAIIAERLAAFEQEVAFDEAFAAWVESAAAH